MQELPSVMCLIGDDELCITKFYVKVRDKLKAMPQCTNFAPDVDIKECLKQRKKRVRRAFQFQDIACQISWGFLAVFVI